jgi:hypothetical protein
VIVPDVTGDQILGDNEGAAANGGNHNRSGQSCIDFLPEFCGDVGAGDRDLSRCQGGGRLEGLGPGESFAIFDCAFDQHFEDFLGVGKLSQRNRVMLDFMNSELRP